MYPLHKMMRERKTALTVYMSRKKSIEAKSGLSFLLVSLLFCICVSCFPFHCQRAYIAVALPSQRAAEKTIGRCLESIASKFIGALVCSSCPLCVCVFVSRVHSLHQLRHQKRCTLT